MSGPSAELAAIGLRWMDAMIRGDGAVLKNLLSPSPDASYCGTSIGEHVTGRALHDGLEQHINEIEGLSCDDGQSWGFAFGDAGWAHWQGTVRNRAAGTESRGRTSLFLRLEQGIWKVHHVHNSFATENLKSLGIEHFAFEKLLASAETLDPRVGRSGSATVMFTDIVGSAALAEALGDARWTETVHDHVRELSALVEAEDGRVIKSLGDGTMSTFGSAGAGMWAAIAIQRALDASVQEPRLQIRIGLHTGDVIDAGDDFFGTVVNKAARIADLAGHGEIVVSEATRIMVGNRPEFALSDPRLVALKGLEGEHLTYRLDWRAGN